MTSPLTTGVRPNLDPALAARRAEFDLPPRDRDNPTVWESIALDPMLAVPPDSRRFQLASLRRPHRLFTKPIVRIFCKALIWLVLGIKRLPVLRSWSSPDTLSRITPYFSLKLCAPETLEQLLRHFTIETQLVNFVARNSGSDQVSEVSLLPLDAEGLADDHGMNAVVRHDVNIFNLIIDLGEATDVDLSTRPLPDIDFSMLGIPEYDLAPGVKRVVQLDLESALSIIVAALAVFMDFATAERAMNSLQLDESLLAAIAEVTGDETFRTWAPMKFPNWLGSPTGDIARDLLWHFHVNEYAHTRLRQLGAVAATA